MLISPPFALKVVQTTSPPLQLEDVTTFQARKAEISKKIDKELENVKYKAFGKAKEIRKPKTSREVVALQKEKAKLFGGVEGKDNLIYDEQVKKIDEQIAVNLLKIQKDAFEKELKALKDIKTSKGKAAAIFKTKAKIVVPKSLAPEAVVLIDPITKTEVTTPDNIKRVSLDYCTDLFTNRKPTEEFSEDIFIKEILHEVRMDEDVKDDMEELSVDRFQKTFDALSKPALTFDDL